MSAYPGLNKEEATRALRVKAAVGALRRRGWDVGSALGELTARCVCMFVSGVCGKRSDWTLRSKILTL